MPPPRRFHAPTRNGDILADPGFDAVPTLVEENRRRLDRKDVIVGGLPLRDLRLLARREVLETAGRYAPGPRFSADAPLLLAGHQPELSHPGVWVKNFALNGLARMVEGIPLNLVVDNDTLKTTSLRFPVLPGRGPKVHLEALAFDRLDSEVPYEDRLVVDGSLFHSFAARATDLFQNWDWTPLLPQVWPEVIRCPDTTPIGERFANVRRRYERNWGCANVELPVSQLSQTRAFARFASHLLNDLSRFREVYNAAINAYRRANGIRSANHPAPDLGPDEAPFWVRSAGGRRARAGPASDVHLLRPRALTLTLFARMCLGDFFIHGIGGGKYDEVTDTIIRDYFGVEPPAYQVLSATLHLPFPGFPSTEADVEQAGRLVRDLTWNPQRHLTPENRARPDVQGIIAEKATLATSEPPYQEHAARRAWFRDLQSVTDRLRPFVWKQVAPAKAALARTEVEAQANAILRRRDYAWLLYPEETLRPFLQRFLNV